MIVPHTKVPAIPSVPAASSRQQDSEMDRLTLFGLFAVTAMLVTYALEARSHWFILAFTPVSFIGMHFI